MDIIINDQTVLNDLDFSKQEKTKVIFEENTSIETAKAIIKTISDLPDNGFKYYKVIFKALSNDKKVELIKYTIDEELCITTMIETLVLLINSSNNYNPEFFNSEEVLFSSIVDYLDICDEIEDHVTKVREKIAYYFFGIVKSYVNSPRLVLSESGNYEKLPRMYEYTLALLDIFNISFILNTPNLKVPNFSDIPNNLKADIELLGVWADKQRFVLSTLSELSKIIENDVENKTGE